MTPLDGLRIRIFADVGHPQQAQKLRQNPLVKGFTTNPSLVVKKVGRLISSYEEYAHEMLEAVDGLPVSFEVLADDLDGMEREARRIAAWGENVWVKVPITTTSGELTGSVVRNLAKDGIKVNVTAVFTVNQVSRVGCLLWYSTPAIISIFAGRVADAGIDPKPIFSGARRFVLSNIAFLWASSREVFNVFQAERAGADIITLSPELIRKLPLVGKGLQEYSLETVRQFHEAGKRIRWEAAL